MTLDKTSPVEKLHQVSTKDGVQIALWEISSQNLSDARDPIQKDIFLTHGTFSNKKVCSGIASYLAELGYCCWIMEWRDHGASGKPKEKFNLETIAQNDFPAAFEYLFEEQGVENLNCITHSGGGIMLTIFLIHYPQYLPHINRMALFCCQAFGAAYDWKSKLKIIGIKCLSFLLGYTPAVRAGLGVHNESYVFMKQWCNWNISGKFLGVDRFDYLDAMPSIRIPVLALSGQGDRFIAPRIGCEKYLDGFQNPKNKLLSFGTQSGHLENYGHSRLMYSSNAKKEIWPVVLEWINS